MRFYSTYLFPALHDWLIDRAHWRRLRSEVLGPAHGEVLEIGAGSGLNLPHYRSHVRHLTLIDPNPGMHRRLQRRMCRSPLAVKRHVAAAEQLPFDDACFDTVVSTLTLCSVQDVMAVVGEVYRVLKPGGQFLFLEHGLSSDERVRTWQRRLNPTWGWMSGGCRLDLDVRGVVSHLPFRQVQIVNFHMKWAPRTHGFMSRGSALR